MQRTYTATDCPTAPLPSDMKKRFFVGKCVQSGAVHSFDVESFQPLLTVQAESPSSADSQGACLFSNFFPFRILFCFDSLLFEIENEELHLQNQISS